MKIKQSWQRYHRVISKVTLPEQTIRNVIDKLKHFHPPILDDWHEIKRKTHIPQYIIKGTHSYANVINDLGRAGYSYVSNGKGHTHNAALASGLMEMIERYSCNHYLFHQPSKQITRSFDELRACLKTSF